MFIGACSWEAISNSPLISGCPFGCSPTASSSNTPVKSQFRAQGALPSLPPRPKFVARQRSQPPSQSKSETEKDATVAGQQEDVVKERRGKREEEQGEKVVKQESEREINNSTSEDQPEDPLKAAESDVRNAGDTSTVSLTSSLTKDMEPTDSKMSISEPLVPKLDDVTGGETNGEQDNEKVLPLEAEKVQPLEPEPKEQPKEEAKQEQEEKGVHADASTGDVSTESPGQEVNHEVDDAEEEEEGAGEEMMEEGKDEEEEGDNEFERIEDIACPALDFSDAPQSSEALTALEERIRSMSIAAHNHLSRDKLT